MISSLISCVWTEEYPHHSYHRALRWNDMFIFKGNCLRYTDNQPFCGPKYDVATDTASFVSDIDESSSVKVKRLLSMLTKLICSTTFNSVLDSAILDFVLKIKRL